jgi:hypothetical protein
MTKYYMHYINNGKAEGRNAVSLLNAASYKGVDYSAVYSAEDYYALNSDVAAAFGNDASALIEHFVNYGMSEGRQAKQSFNVYAYKFYNSDVAGVYGDDTRGYYMHYIQYGVNEGRKATGSIFENVDYSAVFDFEYYAANNADVVNALGYSESALLKHFAQYGVNEGRRGNALFDVNIYKASNSDVAAAFGNNTREYYIHFINYGINEGRASSETGYKGVDYSAVYNRIYYLQNNEDVAAAFGDDAGKLIEHFVDYGMSEGRQASADFNVNNYKARYEDLRNAFGDNLAEYYRHYINNGLAEGRNGN